VSLKIAIVRCQKTQRKISLEAGIPETRLSDFVRHRADPTPDERAALERVLNDQRIFADDRTAPGIATRRVR
jgi:hypothetical protein